MLYDDFNVTAKQREELHESFGREAGELSSQQTGNLWLIDLQDARCTSLSESPRADDSGYANGKVSLGETLLRIW